MYLTKKIEIMKKVFYLITILFTVVLMSTSCKKEDPIPLDFNLTLEEQYPEWSNLTWVSTNGSNDIDTYPKLDITIVDDEIILKLIKKDVYGGIKGYPITFNKMEILVDHVVVISNIMNNILYFYGTFDNNGVTIGIMVEETLCFEKNTYILKIN